ncbi:MAG: hypothetical protein RI575_12655 [Balneolaceae bacterium]|nr:hypothetical protein [Balneolaceae bacterium]MDR9409165.1 hypothetical protein [Balneolaceae bacterium]
MKLQILDAAKNDLIEGFHFYEEQQKGLGDYFLVNLYADIESLKVFWGIHQKVYKDLQRALSKKFPYAIYYSIDEDIVKVRAIIDYRRSSYWIEKHLKNA